MKILKKIISFYSDPIVGDLRLYWTVITIAVLVVIIFKEYIFSIIDKI